MTLNQRKMVKFDICQRLFTIQLILVAINFFPVEVNGVFDGLKQLGGSMIRSVALFPSKVLGGGQKVSHVVGRGLGALTSPVKPLQSLVHAGGGAVSNVLGSTSRLLGRSVTPPHSVIFLYDRPLNNLGGTKEFQETVKVVLGHALSNVIFHSEDMDSTEPIDLKKLTVLRSIAQRLQSAEADNADIYDVVKVLGRNGRADLPKELEKQVVESLIDSEGRFRETGAIEEIRYIAGHPKGYYMLDEQERTDYKLSTNSEYSRCTRIYPPFYEKWNKELH